MTAIEQMRPLGGIQACKWVKRVAALALFCSCSVSQSDAGPAYPLKPSANGRYLVDQKNVPVMVIGDSPQALVVKISESDAALFFADRNAHAFNTMWINLLCDTYTGGRADGSTFQGMRPFTSNIPSSASYDLTTPNEAYFAHVDRVLNLAAQQGLQVMLDPIETGGWLTTMLANGTANCRAFGQYLGKRYRNFPNIIWLSGNDFQGWGNPNNDAVVTSVALGIKDMDTNHFHTIELNYRVSCSLDDPNWAPIIGLNAAYTYFPTYAEVFHAYSLPTIMPVFMVEANYEYENLNGVPVTTPLILRHQEYWTLLSGGAGQLYGNHYTWPFSSGWKGHLDTPGAIQMVYLAALFKSRPWYNLVPDMNHEVVTAGYGTFSTAQWVYQNDFATAASTPDGRLAMVYLPSRRTITVTMSQFSNKVSAQWYDPTSGQYVPVAGGPFPNSGSRNFSPPGNNSAGDGDWILVLTSPAVTGTYRGLFSEPAQVAQRSSGAITTSVTAGGSYSGRLQMAMGTYTFAGFLGPDGRIAQTIAHTPAGPLELDLGFGTGEASDVMTGQIANSNWLAAVIADRAVFNAASNRSPYTNRFTVFFSAQPGDDSSPEGDGFGAVLMNANGAGTISGILADGTPVLQSVTVSKDGSWPLYVRMFGGTSSLWGWLAFTNDPSSDIDGTPVWIKQANGRTRYYPAGFTNAFRVFGSAYLPPVGATNHVLDVTNALVEFAGGNLGAGITNVIALGRNGLVTPLDPAHAFSMRFWPASGKFTGHCSDPESGRNYAFAGAGFQKWNTGYGLLIGTNQTSQVDIQQ